LIDARLIRMQTEKEQGKLVRRKVGKGAVEKSRVKLCAFTASEMKEAENEYEAFK